MPIRRRQKKPNADPREKPNHNPAVVDPMVDPGSPPHRRQARAKADTTRTHHRMVTLAQSSSGGRSASPPHSKTATAMLGGNIEVAAYAGAEIGGRGLPTQQGLDREFLRIGIGFHDGGRNLHLGVTRLRKQNDSPP